MTEAVVESTLFQEFPTVREQETDGLLATIESVENGTASIWITDADGYVDKVYVEMTALPDWPTAINRAFDVAYIGENRVRLTYNDAETERVMSEAEQIYKQFYEDEVIPVEDWEDRQTTE